tara:strand:- start:211 stop:510 length:300 start_codon:yes stop_codon:yes gene_type:complete
MELDIKELKLIPEIMVKLEDLTNKLARIIPAREEYYSKADVCRMLHRMHTRKLDSFMKKHDIKMAKGPGSDNHWVISRETFDIISDLYKKEYQYNNEPN